MQNEDLEIVDINEIVRGHYLDIKEEYHSNEERIKLLEDEISLLLLDEKVTNYLEYLSDQQVIKYLNKCNELDSLKRSRRLLYKKLNQLHQRICGHPAYFVVRDYFDNRNELIYTCSCIECGKRLNKNVKEFNDEVVIYPKDINNSEEEYKKYKKDYTRMMKRVL